MSCWLFARLFQNCQVTATHKQGYFESNGQLCLYGDNSQKSNYVRSMHLNSNGFLVSKETVVLCQWESENKNLVSSNGLIKVELPL